MSHRAATTTVSLIGVVVGVVLWLLCSAPRASAIPAFSRKYQTSCATCHSDYPALNDFGEAFKKNGFKFPKDDESFVKEPPVLLGAKAQKEAFPGAIYPGEIPGSIPIAFRYEGYFNYNSKTPAGVPFVPRTDLFVPNTFTIIGAGSLGEKISFWVDDDISAGGSGANGGLGDGYLKFNDLGHYIGLPKDALNIRAGQFELDLPFTQARTINLTGYDVYNQASIGPTGPSAQASTCELSSGTPCTTNNPFSFGAPQRGIEIGGYPNDGNFSWSVAFVNGSNNTPAMRSSKDVYIRLSQRFNLERDPASRDAVQAAGPTGPRDHTSIRFGGFYYYGRNDLNQDASIFPALGVIREPFYRAGGDFRFKYRALEAYGLVMVGRDANLVPNVGGTGYQNATPVTFTGGFGQVQYFIHPWVLALMRYDFVNSHTDVLNDLSIRNTRNRFSPGIQLLVRANIKVALEYQRQWQEPTATPGIFFRPNGLISGIDYVF